MNEPFLVEDKDEFLSDQKPMDGKTLDRILTNDGPLNMTERFETQAFDASLTKTLKVKAEKAFMEDSPLKVGSIASLNV